MSNKQVTALTLISSFFGLLFYYYFAFNWLDVEIFVYPDFQQYLNNNLIAPNFGYGALVRLLDMALSHPILVFTSISIHIVLLFLLVTQFEVDVTILSAVFFILYIFINPYLAASAFIFDTILFIKIFLIFALLYERNVINIKKLIFFTLILAVFRYSIVLLVLPYLLSYDARKNIKLSAFLLIVLTIILISLAQGDYLIKFNNSIERYDWTEETLSLFTSNWPSWLAYCFVYLIKILLLFGGREAMYTEGIAVFMAEKEYLQLGLSAILALVNIFGCFCFCKMKAFSGQIRISVLFLIIGSLMSVSHARYMTPYMPVFALAILHCLNVLNLLNRRKV